MRTCCQSAKILILSQSRLQLVVEKKMLKIADSQLQSAV